MATHDSWTISALCPGKGWTGMIDVPHGDAPGSFARAHMTKYPEVTECSIYRNGRCVTTVRATNAEVGAD